MSSQNAAGTAGAAPRTETLTRAETLTAARSLLAAEGLEGFSMRKLAANLSVNPMTIYTRFEDKKTLLSAIGEQVLSELVLPARTGSWAMQALALANAVRNQLLTANSAAAIFHSGATELPLTVLRIADHGLWLMQQAGYEGQDAVDAFRALFWHAVSFSLAQPAMARVSMDLTDPQLVQLPSDELTTYRGFRDGFTRLDPDHLFDLTTRLLIDGLVRGR